MKARYSINAAPEAGMAVAESMASRARSSHRDIPVIISTESLEMWKSLGPDLGFTPADYVCGCGAGATPGKRRLDTNPWDDARQARTWDGRPAVPGRG